MNIVHSSGRRSSLAVRLIDLAETTIDSAGVQDVGARALAEAAGCSVGAVFGVLSDLDRLILTVNGRTLDAIGTTMTQAAQGSPAPGAQIERLAIAYLDYAVHGVVELGLGGKASVLLPAALQEQLRIVVAAMAQGLAAHGDDITCRLG